MGKFGKYANKYKRAWEDLPLFKGWLQKNKDENNCNQEAYCRICETALRAQKFELVKHSNTKSHRTNGSKLVSQKTLESCRIAVVSDESKRADLKLAAYVATHSAVSSIDHLNELLVDLGKKSILESLQLHRTKCSKLIANVISPALLVDLVKDVGDESYSLIIDESTDVSSQKYMAVCVKYFSLSKANVVTEFLGIIQIVETTAIALYERLTGYLAEIDLPIKNLIGIGTDGASYLCGKNHSLFTLLKERVPLPNLQIVRCVCHSLHLCSSKASEVLPSSLEFLVRESRNWFAHSALRRAQYADLYNLINDNNKNFLNLVQLSVTRWLAWEGSVKRILYQCLELKTHFETIGSGLSGQEKCYTARTLASMYKDPANHLYLIFLNTTLCDVNEANILFQSTHEDVSKLYETLSSLVLSVASRILKPAFMDKAQKQFENIEEAFKNDLAILPAKMIDFGLEFKNAVAAYDMRADQLDDVKCRCRQYLIVLLNELLKCLPNNMSVLKSSTKLSPNVVLNTARKLELADLPLILLDKSSDGSDISKVEGQLRKIPFVDWSELFSAEVMSSSSAFWAKVYSHQTVGGTQPYKELARFALKILSLPLSNALVERVFSVMNATKTKPRNKMSFDMLDAILRIRTFFHTTGSCCKSFIPSPIMYQKFTSKMYNTQLPLLPTQEGPSKQKDSADELLETMTLFVDEDVNED